VNRIRTELQFHPDPAHKLSANLYDLYHCFVYSDKKKTPGDGHRNCPKHVEFHSKNKFEKLVYLVGFITRMDGIFFFWFIDTRIISIMSIKIKHVFKPLSC